MATVDLRKCNDADVKDPAKLKMYINNFIDQLTFILQNLDEDNMTEKYIKDSNKEDKKNG